MLAVLTIFALILGPILAVQAQAWIERKHESKKGKEYIFKTLMATRADRLSLDHVRALNMISVEFYKDMAIRASFNKYIEHLYTDNRSANSSHEENENKALIWANKQIDLLCDLLQKIGKTLKYDFDIDHIKNFSYTPRAYADVADEQAKLRKSFIELTEGKSAININTIYTTEQQEKQKELLGNLNNLLSGKQAILIKNQETTSQ